MERASLHLLSEFILDLLSQVGFQAVGWGDIALVVTTWLAILIVVPLAVVVGINLELHGVVAGGDSGHVPLKLLYFAALEQVSERDCE